MHFLILTKLFFSLKIKMCSETDGYSDPDL